MTALRKPRPLHDKDWLKDRRGFIGGSDAAPVENLDPYRRRIDIFNDKKGWGVDSPSTDIQLRGIAFQEAALVYLRWQYPDWKVWLATDWYYDPKTRRACTPDAFVERPDIEGLVNCQIKTVNKYDFADWGDQPPIGMLVQVCHENDVLGAAHGILAVLVVDAYAAALHCFDVPRHTGAEQRLRDSQAAFWRDFDAGIPPAPDYSRDGAALRAMMAPVPVDPPIDLSTDNRIHDLLDQRDTLKGVAKEAENELEAIDAELIDKLKGADQAIAGPWKLTWREERRKAYSVAEATRRVLRVTQPKERRA